MCLQGRTVTQTLTRLWRDILIVFCRKPAWLLSENETSSNKVWMSHRTVLITVQIRLGHCRRRYLKYNGFQWTVKPLSVVISVCPAVRASLLACLLIDHQSASIDLFFNFLFSGAAMCAMFGTKRRNTLQHAKERAKFSEITS